MRLPGSELFWSRSIGVWLFCSSQLILWSCLVLSCLVLSRVVSSRRIPGVLRATTKDRDSSKATEQRVTEVLDHRGVGDAARYKGNAM